jgi:hypothetical protein
MTTAPFLAAPPAAPTAADTAKGNPRPDRDDGAAARERGHDKHRRRCRRDMRVAAHAIIDRLLTAGSLMATDLDDLPPAPSGSRTYIGTAFLDLRRNGVIRTAGPPVPTTARRATRRLPTLLGTGDRRRHRAGVQGRLPDPAGRGRRRPDPRRRRQWNRPAGAVTPPGGWFRIRLPIGRRERCKVNTASASTPF